ncbi:reticulon-like protein B12 [Ricinus communis]|uniref:Reticulon-like protein n=1 Tax=Ricinus communis TaxID=3988 RepID=B9SPE8_RICCO|nr:reticulon-like protein B12 [Ricinus communis]EEF34498.1 3-beta-hydroxy-delta5-steroid dehydrogenase, putative [Ricinus communis]|eukprot:XP_002527867.1 reticulon-like protein B12 [Ricinus communis]
MGSSGRLFNRQTTVHEILGGGLVADVILWRQKNVTGGILLAALASWVVFERSGYTLLSLFSSVVLLLVAILFLWAKSAAILNRPAPPLPELHLSEEMANEVASFIRTHVNDFLSVSQDIALGKDTRLFFKVAGYLLLISIVGGLTDFVSLCYTSLVITLTIPALYERHEDFIDKYVKMGYEKSQQLYVNFDVECIGRIRKWILEKQKLS